jgi:hypothetical protein
MIVRRAKYEDLGAMLDALEEYHPTSNHADIPFVRKDAVKILDHYIGDRTCYPIVAFDDDGTLNGMLCAELVPFFFNKKHYFATDLLFISNGAGMQLLAELKKWVKVMDADKIMIAVSSGDPRADAFLELSGLEKTGNMYVLHR